MEIQQSMEKIMIKTMNKECVSYFTEGIQQMKEEIPGI